MDNEICRTDSNDLRNSEHLDDPPDHVATNACDESLQDSEEAATWSFSALVLGAEWDPAVFTSLLNERRSTLAPTLEIATILSYACRNRSTGVPSGYVAVEGYLKLKACRQVKRGTLRRRFKHPDLRITWTACRVGRNRRYTDHNFIQTFHRETALPPDGVLQPSTDAVGLRLRVDYLGPSDAPLNRGGWAGRKQRQAAAATDASGAGAPDGASPAATAAATSGGGAGAAATSGGAGAAATSGAAGAAATSGGAGAAATSGGAGVAATSGGAGAAGAPRARTRKPWAPRPQRLVTASPAAAGVGGALFGSANSRLNLRMDFTLNEGHVF